MSENTPIPQLDEARFKLAEAVRNVYCITVPEGTTRAQVLHPDFWGQVSARWLRPYSRIEVRCDDGTIFGELLVLMAERTFARVVCLAWHDLTTKDVAQTQIATEEEKAAAYEVKHRGVHYQWSVVRAADKAVIKENIPTKAEAEQFRKEYIERA